MKNKLIAIMDKMIAIWHIMLRRNYFLLTERANSISIQGASRGKKGVVATLLEWAEKKNAQAALIKKEIEGGL